MEFEVHLSNFFIVAWKYVVALILGITIIYFSIK